MALRLNIVTAQRAVLERDGVTKLVVPAAEGQITILPKHAALLTALGVGEMVVYSGDYPDVFAVHGGFMQVLDDEVSVLADAAERAEDIDTARAEAARERAQSRLAGRDPELPRSSVDVMRAQIALQRSLIRLRVSRRRREVSGQPSMR
ncbi:MAG: ATP synthase F1 subunit epsilon [Dehalococcoidia bacterium]|nr:ATP synthase F1 subunit epsilon [Dehalococcoidia bacterium]